MSKVTLETLTRAQARRKLLGIGMPVGQVTHVLDHPSELLNAMRPSLTVAANNEAVAIVAAYQRHCAARTDNDATSRLDAALSHIRLACEMALAAVPGGEVRLGIVTKDATGAGCVTADFDVKPLLADIASLLRACRNTDQVCVTADSDNPNLESLFEKWLPLLASHLNDEQLSDLHSDIVRAVDLCRAKIHE